MTVQNVIEKLQELAPKEYAMDWDNVGLLAGRMDKEVKRIFVALEVTDETLEEALAFGADMIITHHPLFFDSFRDQSGYFWKKIDRNDPVRYVLLCNAY